MSNEIQRNGQDCPACQGKGCVFMTITKHDDGHETVGVECWECGTEFDSEHAEDVLKVLSEALDNP
jgi:DNA-directed RNA polymerase subunit M/transcription elongation factor TFIIS